MSLQANLTAVRQQMSLNHIDAYIIGTADPHQSEYPPSFWQTRAWISGFTGSAGTAIITKDHAGLWTDVRYFLQAEHELKQTGFVLHKLIVQTQAEYIDWLCQNLKAGQTVACDFYCFSLGQITQFDKALSEKSILLKDSGDLFQKVWKDRPALSSSKIYEHDIKYAGKSRKEKIKYLREQMKEFGADYFVISALDEVAHVLNLRGNDVDCNPVFISYLLIDNKKTRLFINPQKISPELKLQLEKDGIELMNYDQITEILSKTENKKVWVDTSTINARLALSIPKNSLLGKTSAAMSMKAIKNDKEIKHIRNVMAKDGAALTKAFMWLEDQLKSNKTPTEFELAQTISKSRASMPNYVSESFFAIVGYKGNGAIIHYRPEEKTSAKIKNEGVLLIDSGGQYLDGTTDITRTIALGPISDEIKSHYTAVLKGHIDVCRLIFPIGTKGIQIDAFARQHLWKMGLNYGHGTGHGVGFFMNVHEPPQGIVSAWNQRGMTELVAGMLTSNEPGFYKEDSHGIRVENLVLTVPNGDNFLAFENVTLFPIDTNLIDKKSFGPEYRKWLNEYHKKCYKKISPFLNETEKTWLKEKCKSY